MMRALAILGLAALLAAPFSFAQLKTSPSPAGVWTFKTQGLADSCTISGEMEVAEADKEAKTFSCRFTALQSCTSGVILAIRSEQTCTAAQEGAKVDIRSKVERIVSLEPQDLMKGMDRRYWPDNFHVATNARADRMEGMFDSLGKAPVQFTGKQDLVS